MKISVLAAATLPMLALTPAAHATAHAEARPEIGLGIAGSADHRRPVPGEVQNIRWTVRNLGGRTVDRAWLDTAVPPGWRLDDADDCQVAGHRLSCALGPLERGWHTTVALRMTMPRRAPLGPLRLRAATRFSVRGVEYEGPRTALRLIAVRHR